MESLLKAGFRNNPKNPERLFPHATAALLISPMQPYYQDQEKFEALISLINRSAFQFLYVVIGDTCSHYNFISEGYSLQDSITQSKALGNRWLRTFHESLNRLTVAFEITRWDQWVKHPKYSEFRSKIDVLFATNTAVREAFLASALEYMDRQTKKIQISREQQLSLGLEYLKEECSVIMPLFASLGIEYAIYPANMLEAMQATRNSTILPEYGDSRVHWLSLRFKRMSLPHHEAILA